MLDVESVLESAGTPFRSLFTAEGPEPVEGFTDYFPSPLCDFAALREKSFLFTIRCFHSPHSLPFIHSLLTHSFGYGYAALGEFVSLFGQRARANELSQVV